MVYEVWDDQEQEIIIFVLKWMRRWLSIDRKQEFNIGMDTYKEWQKKDGQSKYWYLS